MDFAPHQPKLKAIFIAFVTVVLAIFLGSIIGGQDYGKLILGAVLALGCYLWFFTGRSFWVFTIASSFLGGTFPILRGQFTPFQILMAMGLAKFLVEDIIFRRTRLKLPGRIDLFLIAGFIGVILFHGIGDRFGMRFLGSSIWGGRHYVNVFVGLAAFFVIQSLPTKPGLWAKFPYFVLAIGGFELLIALVTAAAPASIYFIYPFYSGVATSGLQEILGGPASAITNRLGAVGSFGVYLIILVLSATALLQLFHPANFGRLVLVAAGSLGVLCSGYRTSLLNALLAAVVAGIRDLRYAALLLLPVLAAGLFALSVINSEFIALPKQFQRSLASVPGQWDHEMAYDVRGSNDFRFKVWTLWWRQYFPEQPLLGRGFGFKMEWAKQSVWHGNAVDHQQMVETGNMHNGFLSAVDTFGIIGTLFFVAWNMLMLVRALRVPFDKRSGDYFALRFLALYLAVSILAFWVGAAGVGTFLPQQFALAGLFLRLQRDLKPAETPSRPRSPATPRQFRRELAPI